MDESQQAAVQAVQRHLNAAREALSAARDQALELRRHPEFHKEGSAVWAVVERIALMNRMAVNAICDAEDIR